MPRVMSHLWKKLDYKLYTIKYIIDAQHYCRVMLTTRQLEGPPKSETATSAHSKLRPQKGRPKEAKVLAGTDGPFHRRLRWIRELSPRAIMKSNAR